MALWVVLWVLAFGADQEVGEAEKHLTRLSKTEFQNGTLVSGNMDQNLRNPSCLILSHTHMAFFCGNSGSILQPRWINPCVLIAMNPHENHGTPPFKK